MSEKLFVRKISTYVNASDETRVLVTLQSVATSGKSALFALPLPEGAKVGSVVLQKGMTLEEARRQIAIGEDFSEIFAWGPLSEGQTADSAIHDVVLKG